MTSASGTLSHSTIWERVPSISSAIRMLDEDPMKEFLRLYPAFKLLPFEAGEAAVSFEACAGTRWIGHAVADRPESRAAFG